jgi:WD40 repeat protein
LAAALNLTDGFSGAQIREIAALAIQQAIVTGKTDKDGRAMVESVNPVVSSVSFSPDVKTLAVGSGDGQLGLWHVATGQELATLQGSIGEVIKVQFAEDNSALAAVIIDDKNECRLHIWSSREAIRASNGDCAVDRLAMTSQMSWRSARRFWRKLDSFRRGRTGQNPKPGL